MTDCPVMSLPGISPQSLRGSRTGVFIGVSQSETDTKLSEDPDNINGYGLTGTNRAMFANRVSYTFHFTGQLPSTSCLPRQLLSSS